MTMLSQMEKAGKQYLRAALVVMVIHLVAFVLLYLQLPPEIEYRDDLKPGRQTGPKANLIWLELVFVVVLGMLLYSQQQKKEVKLNWPVNEANRENMYIAARWMLRRVLFWVTMLITVMMTGGMLHSLGIISATVFHIVIPVFAVSMIVVIFHSIMRMQEVNAGRLK